jgi:hypothetical protein
MAFIFEQVAAGFISGMSLEKTPCRGVVQMYWAIQSEPGVRVIACGSTGYIRGKIAAKS